MSEATPNDPSQKEKQVMLNLSVIGDFVKANGFATLICLIGIYCFREVCMWGAPIAKDYVMSNEDTQKKLLTTQDTIAKTQEQTVENGKVLLDLHRTMQQAQQKDSRRIQDLHKAVVKKPQDEDE